MIHYLKPRSSQSQSGFTLIEVLVVIIVIGVLSAIAAPGWLAFINNRRISTMRAQVSDSLRKAQTDAKTTRTMRAVLFEKASDPPRMAIVRCTPTGIAVDTSYNAQDCDLSRITPDWQTLGNGEVKSGIVRFTKATRDQIPKTALTTATPASVRLVFDANGLVKTNLSDSPRASEKALEKAQFVVGFGLTKPGSPSTLSGEPRCVVVQTLLGGISEGNSTGECGSL